MRIPEGFENVEQFSDAVSQFRAAAEVDDAVVGIRGSAATGVNSETGAAFGPSSDLDFFLVSDTLFTRALAMGARESNGALRVGATQRYFPRLHAVEQALSRQLGRKTTIRVFSRTGYESVKADTDIMGV